ncbi:hypothetical protein WJX82_005192 [Trebouxia sp. C0006]
MNANLPPTLRTLTKLSQWFSAHGGWIHPALTVGQSPLYSCRGVISTEDIPITESAFGQQAVILLPTALEVTDAVAKDGLSGRLSSSSLQALQANGWLLATFLAYERHKSASFWQPYLETIPARPSTGWSLRTQDAAHALRQLGSLGQGCKAHIKTRHKQYDMAAQKYARQFGKALGLTASDMLWGFGTVHSRAYVGQDAHRMFPMIDLCNHSQHAANVEGIRLLNDATYVRATIKYQGHPATLPAGHELLLDYGARQTYPSPCDCFSNYGFIPEEYNV